MKIVRKENGNILLTDASGNTIKRLPEYAVLELKKDTEGEYIRAAYGHQNKHDIYVDQITATQIEPNAEVSFNGTGQDLLNLLSTSFFFEVVDSGGAFPYRSGLYTNFQETSSGVSQVAFAANRLVGYYIHVKDTVELESVRISQSGGTLGAGEFVIGIYEIDENLNPTNLVGQSDPLSPFITSVSGPQEVQLQSNITLNNGFYAMAYLSNYAGFSVRGGISAQTFFGSDINISNPFSIGVFSLPVTYSATMPATGSPVVEGSSLFLTQATPFFGFKIV